MARWRHVDEELPNEDCIVDVWWKESETDQDYRRTTDVNYDAKNKEFYVDYDLTVVTEYVEYWMYRPMPPTPAGS